MIRKCSIWILRSMAQKHDRPWLSSHRFRSSKWAWDRSLATPRYKNTRDLYNSKISSDYSLCHCQIPKDRPFLPFRNPPRILFPVIMRFCSFGAPLILLTGQVTLISTVFTPDQIITRFSTAISNIINAIGDASAITADNPTVDYNVRPLHCSQSPTSAYMTPYCRPS